MHSHLAVLLGICHLCITAKAAAAQQRRMLVWLYDCSDATLLALQNHTSSFTAVSPSLYSVGKDSAGDATLSGDATGCVNRIKNLLPGIEVWPWITSPDSLKPDEEDALMRRLFEAPEKFTSRAQEEAKSLGLAGFNVDFEAPGQAPNRNKTFWMESLKWADTFASGMRKATGTPVSFDVMCTANVSSAVLCNNFPPQFNASADAMMVAEMRASAVERFVSMGTYGLDSPTLLNQIDWFAKSLPGKWGLGVCPTCNPAGSESPSELLLRFGTAHAYGVLEVDLFAFSAKYTKQWEAYWPYMRAFLQCDNGSGMPSAGQCWPYGKDGADGIPVQTLHV